MSELQEHYKNDNDIMFLSHSVTPVMDSVPQLKKYALEKGVIDGKWNVTTGNKKHIYNLARKHYFAVLDEGDGWVVKELTINPNKALSDQRHSKRSEHWHIVQGEVTMETEWMGVKRTDVIIPTQSFDIGQGVWHKASNKTKAPVKVIETWFGDELTELDIERR